MKKTNGLAVLPTILIAAIIGISLAYGTVLLLEHRSNGFEHDFVKEK